MKKALTDWMVWLHIVAILCGVIGTFRAVFTGQYIPFVVAATVWPLSSLGWYVLYKKYFD